MNINNLIKSYAPQPMHEICSKHNTAYGNACESQNKGVVRFIYVAVCGQHKLAVSCP